MKLVRGAGSEVQGACWMSALHYYTRTNNEWSDHPDCVSPLVRVLCMGLNDNAEDGEREKLIGPHLFAPIGTNTGMADDRVRLNMCIDTVIRVILPRWLEQAGPDGMRTAGTLRSRRPVEERDHAALKEGMSRLGAHFRRSAFHVPERTFGAITCCWHLLGGSGVMSYHTDEIMLREAGKIVNAAAIYHDRGRQNPPWATGIYCLNKQTLLELILKCCEVGEKKEVTKTCSLAEVQKLVCAE